MNFYEESNLIRKNQCDKNVIEIRTLRWPTAQIIKTQECRAEYGKLNLKVTENKEPTVSTIWV